MWRIMGSVEVLVGSAILVVVVIMSLEFADTSGNDFCPGHIQYTRTK